MPQEQENFQQAVQELLNVVIFENWLRFYFLTEDESKDELRIELPEKAMQKIKTLYPDLYGLAEDLKGRPVDFETSKRAVLTYIMDEVDGKKIDKGMAQSALSSQTFQVKLQLFNTWAQLHEEQLDQGFLDYGKWKELFTQWLKGKKAQELAKQLAEQPAGKI